MSTGTVPKSIRAGDSTVWRSSFADYKASAGWALAYRLVPRSGGAAKDIAAGADGDDFEVSLSASDTASYVAGEYTLVGRVTKASESFTVYADVCTVQPNLMTATSLDDRSTARRIVEAIDAWLSGKAGWAGEKTLGDRHIKDHPLPDLIRLRDRYAQDIAAEDAAASLFAGEGSMRGRVMVRM